MVIPCVLESFKEFPYCLIIYSMCCRLPFRRGRHPLGNPKRADITGSHSFRAKFGINRSIPQINDSMPPLTVPCVHKKKPSRGPGAIPYWKTFPDMYGWEVGPCPHSPTARDYPVPYNRYLVSHRLAVFSTMRSLI